MNKNIPWKYLQHDQALRPWQSNGLKGHSNTEPLTVKSVLDKFTRRLFGTTFKFDLDNDFRNQVFAFNRRTVAITINIF